MPRCGDGAGHRTGAARADLCDQASWGPHVRAWRAHSRYAKSGGRFHPCRPGVEPRRCDVGRDDKHWGSFNEALSKVTTRRALSARSRIPQKNLCQAGLAPKARAGASSARNHNPSILSASSSYSWVRCLLNYEFFLTERTTAAYLRPLDREKFSAPPSETAAG